VDVDPAYGLVRRDSISDRQKRGGQAMMSEKALEGWKAIADYLGVSERKARNYKKEFLEAGVIFKKRMGCKDHDYMICAFPQNIRQWTMIKARKGEMI
jgi:hypothetical protein